MSDAPTRPVRVLIVDDDPHCRQQVQDILNPIFEVRAPEGIGTDLLLRSLEIARQFRPHIVILDLQLDPGESPDLKGLSVLEGLQWPRIIPYSANLSAANTARIMRSKNVDTWVSKGGSPQELVQVLSSAATKVSAFGRKAKVSFIEDRAPGAVLETLHIPAGTIENLVDDLTVMLFPRSTLVSLEPAINPEETSQIVPARAGGREILFKAWHDRRIERLVVRFTSGSQADQEVSNYTDHVQFNLGGKYQSSIVHSASFYELGGVAYQLQGCDPDQLGTFSRLLLAPEKTQTALNLLDHFFGEVWGGLYRNHLPVDKGKDWSLFADYNRCLDLNRHLRGVQRPDPPLFQALSGASFIDPVGWLHENRLLSAQVSAAQQAVTHGSLHADNLLTDGQGIWAVNFENAGPAPALRDFVRLETDLLTRLGLPLDAHPERFLQLAAASADPAQKGSAAFRATRDLNRNPRALLALRLIARLRDRASELVGYHDQREYLWGLLFSALDEASLAEDLVVRQRAWLLSAVLCERLQHWAQPRWIPPSWGSFHWEPLAPLSDDRRFV